MGNGSADLFGVCVVSSSNKNDASRTTPSALMQCHTVTCFLEIVNNAVATEDYYLPICGGMGMTMDTANSTEAVEGDSHGGTNNNKVDSVLKNSPDGGDMIKESGGGDRKSLEQLLDKFDSWKQGNVLFPVALGWIKKAKKERFYSAVTTEKDGTKVSLDEQSRIVDTAKEGTNVAFDEQ